MELSDRAVSGPTRRRFVLAGALPAVALLAGCGGDAGDGSDSGGSGDGEATDSGDGDTTPDGTTSTPFSEPLAPPVAGDPDADVTLAVYEDYACPHCADYNEKGFPEIEEAYVASGDIRYEHRDLPIPVADPGSFQAANAARAVQDAAGDEAFWTYSDALFARSGDIAAQAPDLFESLADEQGHDGGAIRGAAVNRLYRQTVERDRQRAIDLGAEATPTFAVNGEIVASGFGSDTVGMVRAALDEALA